MLRFAAAKRGRLVGALAALVVTLGVGCGALSSPAHPSDADPGSRLIFDAKFRGSGLDTSVWATCYPWADVPAGCTNFGNTEYQWYLPSQVRVSDGALRLEAQRVPTHGRTASGKPKEYGCRSGMVTTYPSLRFRYGYVQVVARIPTEAGLWPTLWLLPANLHWPPEIDMLESRGPPAREISVTLHQARGAKISAFLPQTDVSTGWHTFSLSWSPSHLEWFVDGREVLLVHQHVPQQAMYFIANLAEYDPPKSSAECSGTLLIRSVKVWQR